MIPIKDVNNMEMAWGMVLLGLFTLGASLFFFLQSRRQHKRTTFIMILLRVVGVGFTIYGIAILWFYGWQNAIQSLQHSIVTFGVFMILAVLTLILLWCLVPRAMRTYHEMIDDYENDR